MDKLTRQLKTDAGQIEVRVSDELDRRINASLYGVSPERAEGPANQPTMQRRPAVFWWVSSLTGLAVALVGIAIINSRTQPDEAPSVVDVTPVTEIQFPAVNWNAETAMLTSPLQEELEDLHSDIKKIEAKVRQDIGL